VVVIDVRGRGRSDVPETGYTWEHHISDVRAAVETLGLDRPIVVAFSRGSSYGLGYALTYPTEVRGLVIGDYFARHVGLRAGLPIQTPAVTVNRLCGSGFEAVVQGAQQILLGESRVVLAGGAESMSQAPHVVRGAVIVLFLLLVRAVDDCKM